MLNSHLATALCNTVKKYDILFKEEHEWNMENVLKSKTIKEFDSRFTSIHFGYGSVDNYYAEATLHNKLHRINVPTLCLSAADDPFQPLDGELPKRRVITDI
jgi:abhydrolase domain-containing protein 1/3